MQKLIISYVLEIYSRSQSAAPHLYGFSPAKYIQTFKILYSCNTEKREMEWQIIQGHISPLIDFQVSTYNPLNYVFDDVLLNYILL